MSAPAHPWARGIDDTPPAHSMLWSQPYVPLQLDLREGVNVQQLLERLRAHARTSP